MRGEFFLFWSMQVSSPQGRIDHPMQLIATPLCTAFPCTARTGLHLIGPLCRQDVETAFLQRRGEQGARLTQKNFRASGASSLPQVGRERLGPQPIRSRLVLVRASGELRS